MSTETGPGGIDRREALKRTAWLLGYAVTGSAMGGVLSGFRAARALDWSPTFFSIDQAAVLSEMAEHLLPKSSTPGAKDVLVNRFIDGIMKDYFSPEEQQAFAKGLDDFEADTKRTTGKSFVDAAAADRDAMFRKYEAQSPAVPPTIWGGQITAQVPPLTFYRQFKQLVLLGYYTSEEVGKHILVYDPVPGRFDGCIPLSDVGNAWTLT